MFQDIDETTIREVVDPLLPSVLLAKISQAKNHFDEFAQGKRRIAEAFGVRFQVFLGFSEPGYWAREGVSSFNSRRGLRFEHRSTKVLLAARILLEKGLLEVMAERDSFDYKRFYHFADNPNHYQYQPPFISGVDVWCQFVSSHDPEEKDQARLFVDACTTKEMCRV